MTLLCVCDRNLMRCTVCGVEDRFCGSPRACPAPQASAAAAPVADLSQPIGHGPGTELKKLLARVGITSTPDCSCNRVAAEMDAWGPDECETPERLDYIVAAMRENAERRGMPFIEVAAKMLVRRAIKNARRAAENTAPARVDQSKESRTI